MVRTMTFKSLRSASKYAGVSQTAIQLWIDKYDIGEFIDGRWHIDKDKLDRVIAVRASIAEAEASLRQAG